MLGQYAFEFDAPGRARALIETLLQPTGAALTDTTTNAVAAPADDAFRRFSLLRLPVNFLLLPAPLATLS